MALDWWTAMPLWVLGLLVVGGFVTLGVAGLALTRAWVGKAASHPNDLAGFVYAVVGVTYAVLIGMSALAAYDRFNDVQQAASMEANAIADLYRDLEGYPQPTRTRLQSQLRAYVHTVLERELPTFRRGGKSEETWPMIDRLVVDWVGYEPRTTGQTVLHAQALKELNEFLSLRRSRLQEGQRGLHPVIWVVLLTGAVLTVGFTYLFWADSHRLHGMMVGLLAGVIGLIVFWMVAMDYPLMGPLAISADSFEDVSVMIDRLSPELVGTPPVPR